MSNDPVIRNARAVAGKLREAWLRADASATTATVDRDDLDAAREALLNLSALLECVDGAALTRAHNAMAMARANHASFVVAAHDLSRRYIARTTPEEPADKED